MVTYSAFPSLVYIMYCVQVGSCDLPYASDLFVPGTLLITHSMFSDQCAECALEIKD